MTARKPLPTVLPRLWLMTDEKMGDGLMTALLALPRGSGVVFRHYSLDKAARKALLLRVEAIAKRRRLIVTVGGTTHGRRRGAITAPVHNVRERIAAERAGVALLFLSPVYATRSHIGATALGRVRFGLIRNGARRPVIALGGMNARRARALRAFNIHGWAGIDALIGYARNCPERAARKMNRIHV